MMGLNTIQCEQGRCRPKNALPRRAKIAERICSGGSLKKEPMPAIVVSSKVLLLAGATVVTASSDHAGLRSGCSAESNLPRERSFPGARSLRSVDWSLEWSAMIAFIAETIGAYRNQDRRHETIAPFLPVQMRTGRAVKSQMRDQS
jgi:hypothetical protein